ncbi:MAG: PmoA family protein [Phycisphaerae bacterium]|nr:PmoA family protein [Phycisphaerae bacterium]
MPLLMPNVKSLKYTVRKSPFFAITILVSVLLSVDAQAQDSEKASQLSWKQTETSIALLNHGRLVWEHVHDKAAGKPYMRIGLLDGTELTRPWPVPAGYSKADHPWHKALWWSFKILNGSNFWEENQLGTEPTRVDITHAAEGDAQISITLMYHLPDQAPVLQEERRIHVSKPNKNGSYFIDWQARFTALGPKEVVFGEYRYGGLSLRMAAELNEQPAWQFLANTEEVTANGTSVPTRWMAYQGTAPNTRQAALAIFDHPGNAGHPATWLVRDNYPYMNPTFPGQNNVTLKPKETLTLHYGIWVHQDAVTKAQIERRWKRFARDEAASPR